MVAKKIVISLLFAVLLSAGGLMYVLNQASKQTENYDTTPQDETNISQPIKKTTPKPLFDLYSNTVYDLPLLSIIEISKMPKELKKEVDEILETSQGFYLLKYNETDNRVFIILQNPINISDIFSRHNLEFVDLYFNPETKKIDKTIYSPAYKGEIGEVTLVSSNLYPENENWEIDNNSEIIKPLKHTVYNEKGKINFVEIWNYDEKKDIKYQLKNSSKKIISILKEYKQGEFGLRKEHLFYNSDGQLILSLTINYNGANITRVMYYDSHNPEDSLSIISHYENGFKTKEEIYNKDYTLYNTVVAEYQNEKRTKIQLLNSANEIVKEISNL